MLEHMAHARDCLTTVALLTLVTLGVSACAAEPAGVPPVTETIPEPAEELPAPEPEPEPAPEPEPEFNMHQHSLDDPNSIWVVVNKRRPLNPLDYAPADLVFPEGIANRNGQPLRAEAADAAVRMLEAAQAEGVWFQLGSAYRDYARQDSLYHGYIARDGQAAADTYSARPGHSEHQTGLTADFDDGGSCYLLWCFADTEAGMWLEAHAHEFGWILRYPEGYDHITGYTFEPWHFRYVGIELATEMREQGVLTLEEFFGLGPAPDYAG